MKIEDMQAVIDYDIMRNGNILFRPVCQYGFFEVAASEVKGALDEVVKKIPAVSAGLDEFTACEKLMFRLLVQHCGG